MKCRESIRWKDPTFKSEGGRSGYKPMVKPCLTAFVTRREPAVAVIHTGETDKLVVFFSGESACFGGTALQHSSASRSRNDLVDLGERLGAPRGQSITTPTITRQTFPFREKKSVTWAPGRNFPT